MVRATLVCLLAVSCITRAVCENASETISPKTLVGEIHSRLIPYTKERIGTAWCLNRACDLVVTNYHVASHDPTGLSMYGDNVVNAWFATGPDDSDVRALPSAFGTQILNISRDIAILQLQKPLSRKGMHGVPLFPGELRDGESVKIFSYPHGKLTVTIAHFHSTIEQGVLEFDLDSILTPGCSGGVVLNTRNEAVGLLFGLSHSERTAFAVPIWSLADFVKTINRTLYTDLFSVVPAKPDLHRQLVPHSEPQVEFVNGVRDADTLNAGSQNGTPPGVAIFTKVKCLRKPSRPTNAIEIYRYVMARLPLERDEYDLKPYYTYGPGNGFMIKTPYYVTEEDALDFLRQFYYQPPKGTSSKEIAAFLDLLIPPAPTHPVAADGSGRHFKVDVQAAKIPFPEPWAIVVSPRMQPHAKSVPASEPDECRFSPDPELAPTEMDLAEQ